MLSALIVCHEKQSVRLLHYDYTHTHEAVITPTPEHDIGSVRTNARKYDTCVVQKLPLVVEMMAVH